jgi:hypothetical protein
VALASLNGFGPESFDLDVASDRRVFDLIAGQEITGRLSARALEAGEGAVLLVGSEEDFQRDCRWLQGQHD